MTRLLPTEAEPLSALLPFAAARLLVVDIDGTLIAQPNEELFEQLSWLVTSLQHWRSGVTCTVATGRAWNGARRYVDDIVLSPTTPVIVYNGAATCTVGGELLNAARIPAGAALAVVRAAVDAGYPVLGYHCETGIQDSSLVERVVGWGNGLPPVEFNGLPVTALDPLEALPFEPVAMLVPTSDGGARATVAGAAAATGVITVTSSSPAYIELRPSGADKGTAVSRLAARLGVPVPAVICVGDNDNDVELLRVAGVGVAVGNASPAAKAAADYVCRRPAAEGVLELFRLVREARRFARGPGWLAPMNPARET
jgi:hydroxymethylpyrimidine pyrophosphatase-like HAD family hydrolase